MPTYFLRVNSSRVSSLNSNIQINFKCIVKAKNWLCNFT